MVGTFDAVRGWVGASQDGSTNGTLNRCSQGGNGPPNINGIGQFANVYYQTKSFFSGVAINISGSGTEEELMFPAGGSQTIGGKTYYYKTKNNWLVGCLGAIKNGTGQGFTVRLPDGRSYNFDWMVTRAAPYIIDQTCNSSPDIFPTLAALEDYKHTGACITGPSIPRNQVFLYATSATDRFGNTTTYTYDPNVPEHLLQIASSDGGLIKLSYGTSGPVSTITTGSRTWTYGYNSALTSVTLPDGSQWSMDYGQNTSGVTKYDSRAVWLGCHINIGTKTTDAASGTNDTNTVTMTHPSGARGTFLFRKILHGTREAEANCYEYTSGGDALDLTPIVNDPSDYQTASLVSKTLAIPGASTLQWTYQYHPGWVAPYQSQTTVTDSAQVVRQYVYGNDYTKNYGQLLQETVTDPSGLLRTVAYQYVGSAAGQNFTNYAGAALAQPLGWEAGFHTLNRPLYSTTMAQQGKSFYMTVDTGCPSATVYCFDSFVRPTRVIRGSQ